MKYDFLLPTYDEISKFKWEEINQIYYRMGTYDSRIVLSHLCCNRKPLKLDGELITCTRDIDENKNICIKCFDNEYNHNSPNSLVSINSSTIAFHPVIKFSTINKKQINKLRTYIHNDVCCFEFGEYPTKIVEREYEFQLHSKKNKKINTPRTLEKKYKKNQLQLTGKKYMIIDQEFDEYTDGNNKYIRYVKNKKSRRYYWIVVKPLTWIYNKDMDLAISYYPLIGGIPFTKENDYYGKFSDTYIKKYLDEHFSIDILPLNYNLLEKSMKEFNITDNIRNICYELIDNNYPDNAYEYKTFESLYSIKTKYPNLNEDDCEVINSIMLQYQSLLGQAPSYFENKIKKRNEEQEKKSQEDLEYQIQKLEIADEKRKQELEKQIIMNAVSDVLLNIPKESSSEDIIERIYKQNSKITNKQLIKILKIYKEKIKDEQSKKEKNNYLTEIKKRTK